MFCRSLNQLRRWGSVRLLSFHGFVSNENISLHFSERRLAASSYRQTPAWHAVLPVRSNVQTNTERL